MPGTGLERGQRWRKDATTEQMQDQLKPTSIRVHKALKDCVMVPQLPQLPQQTEDDMIKRTVSVCEAEWATETDDRRPRQLDWQRERCWETNFVAEIIISVMVIEVISLYLPDVRYDRLYIYINYADFECVCVCSNNIKTVILSFQIWKIWSDTEMTIVQKIVQDIKSQESPERALHL